MDTQIWGCLIVSRQCRCLVYWMPWKPDSCNIQVQQLCKLLVLTSRPENVSRLRRETLSLQQFSIVIAEASEFLVGVVVGPGQVDFDVHVRAAQTAHSFKAVHSEDVKDLSAQDVKLLQRSLSVYTARDFSSGSWAQREDPVTPEKFLGFQERILPSILQGPVCTGAYLAPFTGIPAVQQVLLVEVEDGQRAVLLRGSAESLGQGAGIGSLPPAGVAAGPHSHSIWRAVQEACVLLVQQKAKRKEARLAALEAGVGLGGSALSPYQLPSSPEGLHPALSAAASTDEREAAVTIHFREYSPALLATAKLVSLPGNCCCMVVFFQLGEKLLGLGGGGGEGQASSQAEGLRSPILEVVSSRTGGVSVPLAVRAAIKAASKCFKLAFPKAGANWPRAGSPLKPAAAKPRARGHAVLAGPSDGAMALSQHAGLPGALEHATPAPVPSGRRAVVMPRLALSGLARHASPGSDLATPSAMEALLVTPRLRPTAPTLTASSPGPPPLQRPLSPALPSSPAPQSLARSGTPGGDSAAAVSLGRGLVGPPTPQPHPPQSPRQAPDAPQPSPRRHRALSPGASVPVALPSPLPSAAPLPLLARPSSTPLQASSPIGSRQSRAPGLSPRSPVLRTLSGPALGKRHPTAQPPRHAAGSGQLPQPPLLHRQPGTLSPRLAVSTRPTLPRAEEAPFSFKLSPALQPALSTPSASKLHQHSPQPSRIASPRRIVSRENSLQPADSRDAPLRATPSAPASSQRPLTASPPPTAPSAPLSPRRLSAPPVVFPAKGGSHTSLKIGAPGLPRAGSSSGKMAGALSAHPRGPGGPGLGASGAKRAPKRQ